MSATRHRNEAPATQRGFASKAMKVFSFVLDLPFAVAICSAVVLSVIVGAVLMGWNVAAAPLSMVEGFFIAPLLVGLAYFLLAWAFIGGLPEHEKSAHRQP